MDYDGSDGAATLPTAVKILIAGGFGAGKTTMVGTLSETGALRTEELLTEEGVEIDDLEGVEDKATTTVVMDFGRITLADNLLLYLFGTPGQDRFSFIWDELTIGALGAVVLADTRRLADCFPSVDYFERNGVPFVVAVNCFEGAKQFELEEVEAALNLDPDVPVVLCDARSRESCKDVLVELLQRIRHVIEQPRGASAPPPPGA
jgi:signal recognition particle receptor subunit beta